MWPVSLNFQFNGGIFESSGESVPPFGLTPLVVLAAALHTEKADRTSPCLFHCGQNAAPSVVDMVQCTQPGVQGHWEQPANHRVPIRLTKMLGRAVHMVTQIFASYKCSLDIHNGDILHISTGLLTVHAMV